jgi:hypothetical protein
MRIPASNRRHCGTHRRPYHIGSKHDVEFPSVGRHSLVSFTCTLYKVHRWRGPRYRQFIPRQPSQLRLARRQSRLRRRRRRIKENTDHRTLRPRIGRFQPGKSNTARQIAPTLRSNSSLSSRATFAIPTSPFYASLPPSRPKTGNR